jgi:hypothetical protein
LPNKVFVDTSGWANLFVATESYYEQAKQWFQKARQHKQEMVTTNYVVIELVALLNSLLRMALDFILLRTAIFNTLHHVCQYQSIQLILLSSRYPAQNYKEFGNHTHAVTPIIPLIDPAIYALSRISQTAYSLTIPTSAKIFSSSWGFLRTVRLKARLKLLSQTRVFIHLLPINQL